MHRGERFAGIIAAIRVGWVTCVRLRGFDERRTVRRSRAFNGRLRRQVCESLPFGLKAAYPPLKVAFRQTTKKKSRAVQKIKLFCNSKQQFRVFHNRATLLSHVLDA